VDNDIRLNKAGYSASEAALTELPATPSRQTRRIYDILAPLYPLSTMLFHSRAHRRALAAAGIVNGMRVLEVAIGSGEMYHRLVKENPDGQTVGIDISPNMAAKTQEGARKSFPKSSVYCQAADARHMPFPDNSFDSLVCCYMLELLATDDMIHALKEFRRVLRPNCRLTLILIGQEESGFNAMYKVATKVAPAFWGRQVEQRVPNLLRARGFEIERDENVKQIFYPSRVLTALNV
jgi:ubiquinone/menaquinone biosynthesis C-methylase UbiE